MLQVRKPINKDALGKSQEFEQQLAPLIDALGGQRWLDDWQTFDDKIASGNTDEIMQLKAVS